MATGMAIDMAMGIPIGHWYGIDIVLLPILPIGSTLPIISCPSPPSSPNVSVNACVLTIKTPRSWTEQTQFALHEQSP